VEKLVLINRWNADTHRQINGKEEGGGKHGSFRAMGGARCPLQAARSKNEGGMAKLRGRSSKIGYKSSKDMKGMKKDQSN